MILDHIAGLELPDDAAKEHFDSCMALARLGEGLCWLYGEVLKIERQTRRQAAKSADVVVIVGGVLDGKPMGVLSCAFQWYAVSACNYAQLVGWLAWRDEKRAKDYVKQVMPRLLRYRHKVAAHFALTVPRHDNEADLAASVMTQIVYARGRLCAAALTPVVQSGEQEVTVSEDFSWSLTRAHERLAPRYWPGGPPKAYQSLRIGAGETVSLNISWSHLVGETEDAG